MDKKTKMPFPVAVALLATLKFWELNDRAFGDIEFGWRSSDEQVAGGYYSGRGGYQVWLNETPDYLATDFEGDLAKQLYDAGGKTCSVDYNDAGDPRFMNDDGYPWWED